MRVTALQEPKLPHEPPERVAVARSSRPLAGSIPDSASEPLSSVTPTERVVYQGPPVRVAVWPVGAVESAEIVSESPEERPAPLVAVSVVEPSAVAPAVQA